MPLHCHTCVVRYACLVPSYRYVRTLPVRYLATLLRVLRIPFLRLRVHFVARTFAAHTHAHAHTTPLYTRYVLCPQHSRYT